MAAMALGIGSLYMAAGGATTAFAIGLASMAANYFLTPAIEGPRLKDLQPPQSRIGAPIPKGFGVTPSVGTIVWATGIKEKKHTDSGKGGPKQTSYTYSGSYGLSFGLGPIRRIRAIMLNDLMIYDWNGGDERGEEDYLGKKRSGKFFAQGSSSSFVVTGSGDSNYDGVYTPAGVKNGFPYYKSPRRYCYRRSNGRWCFDKNLDEDVYPYYSDDSNGNDMPLTGWKTGKDGTGAPPVVNYNSRGTTTSTMFSMNGKVRIRLGTMTQLPDPAEEASVGAGNAPAYLGQVTIYFEDLDLTNFGGQWPQVTIIQEEPTTNLAAISDWIAEACDVLPGDKEFCEVGADKITGFILPQRQSASTYLNQVGMLGVADFVERDWQLRALKRGRSVSLMIPQGDMQSHDDGEEMPPFEFLKQGQVTAPRESQVAYIDSSRKYTTATARAWREVDGESGGVHDIDMSNAVMTNAEARRYGEIGLYTTLSQMTSTEVSLSGPYSYLSTGDVVAIQDRDQYVPVILNSSQESLFGNVTFKATTYEKSTYDYPLPENTAALQPSLVRTAGEYYYALIDTNSFKDDYNNAPHLMIVVATPEGTNFRKVKVSSLAFTQDKDADNLSEPGTITINDRGMIGEVVGALGPYPYQRADAPGSFPLVDDVNTITVDMIYGDLDSITEDEFMYGAAEVANGFPGAHNPAHRALSSSLPKHYIVVGREIILYKDASFIGTVAGRKRYEIKNLMRGMRGTEWYHDKHQPKEAFVSIGGSGINMRECLRGAVGTPIELNGGDPNGSTQESVSLVFYGNTVKPYSPHFIEAARSSGGNITFTWERRSRYSDSDWWSKGTSPILGEEVERYEIEILEDASDNAVRAYTVTTNSLSYPASDQVADFGVVKDQVRIKVTQMSAVVGEGYSAIATV